ncbi:MAG TPA: glutamate 5-kinase [Candidatus Sumerlaeota bacterium]|nr:glutamate 5-kinase [Candidatus Sumerlaeota bacterium]
MNRKTQSDKTGQGMESLGLIPRRIVLKLGSAVLTRPGDERLDENLIDDIAMSVSRLFDEGREVIIVTSGAVAAGKGLLRIPRRSASIPEKQALAAVGQSRLMQVYSMHFERYGRNIAQLLLTRDDMDDRRRYLNTNYAMEKLLSLGVVPIINENDTTTVDELRFGDNDGLSAMVAAKMKAEFLIILSDVDGLYDKDPRTNPDARLITRVEKVTPAIEAMAANPPSRLGAGGMRSKIEAARSATLAGTWACICCGKKPGILGDLFAGRCPGTLFVPDSQKNLSGRERWIAFGKAGTNRWLVLDDGARKALVEGKKSLLAVGIRDVRGNFERGDVVEIRDGEGLRLGCGLINFSSDEVRRIQGARSEDVKRILGQKEYNEVIHRDNMILFS